MIRHRFRSQVVEGRQAVQEDDVLIARLRIISMFTWVSEGGSASELILFPMDTRRRCRSHPCTPWSISSVRVRRHRFPPQSPGRSSSSSSARDSPGRRSIHAHLGATDQQVLPMLFAVPDISHLIPAGVKCSRMVKSRRGSGSDDICRSVRSRRGRRRVSPTPPPFRA